MYKRVGVFVRYIKYVLEPFFEEDILITMEHISIIEIYDRGEINAIHALGCHLGIAVASCADCCEKAAKRLCNSLSSLY